MDELIAFLLGEAPLDGVWFGERKEHYGQYWWRTKLREAWNRRALLEAATQPPAIDLDAVISLLSDDALATSFQTLGQYRAHLIGVLKSKAPDEFFNNKDQPNASNP